MPRAMSVGPSVPVGLARDGGLVLLLIQQLLLFLQLLQQQQLQLLLPYPSMT